VCHGCRSRSLNIVKGGKPGAPIAEPWIGESNASNGDPSNAFSSRSRNPPTRPYPLTMAATNEAGDRSRRDIGESSSLGQSSQNQIRPLLQSPLTEIEVKYIILVYNENGHGLAFWAIIAFNR
jgi:hypothetical protein